MAVFDPTAGNTEFDSVPGLREAWSDYIKEFFERNLYGPGSDAALGELRRWGMSDSDLRFYSPASMPIVAGSQARNVVWQALPTSFDDDHGAGTPELHEFLDERQKIQGKRTRPQDEYCEWVVARDAAGQPTRIVFTSEPPEYYDFLYDDPMNVGRAKTRKLLLEVYKERCGSPTVKLKDLEVVKEGETSYTWYNEWNNVHCVHMQQPNNTLFAQVNIAARACILRRSGGKILTDAHALILCAEYGEPSRQSDPQIGAVVNRFARENRFLTLENPVGLYMTGLNTIGWSVRNEPDADPQTWWRVLKGKADANPESAMIVRAEVAPPAGSHQTLNELLVAGVPVRYGAHVAAHIQMRLGVLASEPQSTMSAPRAIGCTKDTPTSSMLSMPRSRRRRR